MSDDLQALIQSLAKTVQQHEQRLAVVERLLLRAAANRGAMSPSKAMAPKDSPYLDAEQAAAYLGISMTSLYGQVERRHLEPLRGPRRSYRFTTKMLDDYLRRTKKK